jgi:hypothetical protein
MQSAPTRRNPAGLGLGYLSRIDHQGIKELHIEQNRQEKTKERVEQHPSHEKQA